MAAPRIHVCGELERGHTDRLITTAERAVRDHLEGEARRRGLSAASHYSTPALRIAVVALRRRQVPER